MSVVQVLMMPSTHPETSPEISLETSPGTISRETWTLCPVQRWYTLNDKPKKTFIT